MTRFFLWVNILCYVLFLPTHFCFLASKSFGPKLFRPDVHSPSSLEMSIFANIAIHFCSRGKVNIFVAEAERAYICERRRRHRINCIQLCRSFLSFGCRVICFFSIFRDVAVILLFCRSVSLFSFFCFIVDNFCFLYHMRARCLLLLFLRYVLVHTNIYFFQFLFLVIKCITTSQIK